MGLIDELNEMDNKKKEVIKGVRSILDSVNLFSKTPEKDKCDALDKIHEYLESEGY